MNNLTDFEGAKRMAMETSVATATAVRSTTPSTGSGVSFQWVNDLVVGNNYMFC